MADDVEPLSKGEEALRYVTEVANRVPAEMPITTDMLIRIGVHVDDATGFTSQEEINIAYAMSIAQLEQRIAALERRLAGK